MMRTLVRLCERAVEDRWWKYDVMFDSEVLTISGRFGKIMKRRGHTVRPSCWVYSLDWVLLCCLAVELSTATM
jgi:hypothetical protein